MNDGQGQGDRKYGEARGAPAEVTPRMTIKKERQDGLDNGAGKEIVMTWAQIAIAVRGETAKNKPGGLHAALAALDRALCFGGACLEQSVKLCVVV